MKRKIFALFFLLAAAGLSAEPAQEYVNMKFLEKEKGVTLGYDWDKGEISVKKGAIEMKVMLNYPYIISGDTVIRVDIPPFTEGGNIFIGNYAYEKISQVLDGGVKEAVSAPVPVAEVKAKPAEAPAPFVEKTGAAPVENEESPVIVTEKSVPAPKSVLQAATPEPTKKPTETVVVEETSPMKKARKLIVLDPGHGGNDPGAIGPNKLEEKSAVLAIAMRVKSYLAAQSVDVMVTRNDDVFIPLKNRATFANTKEADLFVSIHCNSSPSSTVRGTRSYIYSRVASSKEAAEAAKFENKDMGVLEFLLHDLRKGADEDLSIEAAGNIQHSLVKSLALRWEPTERAPFYVLANTNMPSVLVETAFISNPSEAERLNDANFRDKLAHGIAEGIIEYLKKIK
jgi:N-acetylmuramoyl-L-alanine amidase